MYINWLIVMSVSGEKEFGNLISILIRMMESKVRMNVVTIMRISDFRYPLSVY